MSIAERSERARAAIGRALERGRRGTALERAIERAWAATAGATLARPMRWPDGALVVGIGSAVLGGAGKTPVAIAIARGLARRGERVAIVGHAYRASPGRARRVRPDDPVSEVGDDALDACRALVDAGVAVFVAPERSDALAAACGAGARVVLVDGALAARPRPFAASILVVDASAPFGAGACPPLGDLRARPRDLVAKADVVAVVGDAIAPDLARLAGARVVRIHTELEAAVAHDGARRPLASLAGRPVGLVTGVARPERVVRALAAHAIEPCARILAPDHARFREVVREAERLGAVEAWLTTTRCATKLPARIGDAPVLALARRLDTGDLVRALEPRLVARGPAGGRVASKTPEPLC